MTSVHPTPFFRLTPSPPLNVNGHFKIRILTNNSPASRSDLNNDEGALKVKASAFAGLDRDSLRDLISKASSDLKGDPAFYSMLVENLLASDPKRNAGGKANPNPAAAEEEQNATMNGTSLSPFLPSFLETTCDAGLGGLGEVTLVEDTVMKRAATATEEAPKMQGWVAKVPSY